LAAAASRSAENQKSVAGVTVKTLESLTTSAPVVTVSVRVAASVSCGQDIAGDGDFSLGMIAEYMDSLVAYGASFYRNLFWEAGLVGQVLYLEAEEAGIRSTGIGCYFDDPVPSASFASDSARRKSANRWAR
jgi:hypothetical protein